MPTGGGSVELTSGNDSQDAGTLLRQDVIDRVVELAHGTTGRPPAGDVEAEATTAGRARYWALFREFCREYGGRDEQGQLRRGLTPLPATPDTVTEFVGYLAHRGHAPATIRQAVAAVRARHRKAGEPAPDPTSTAAAVRGYEAELRAAGWQPRRSAPARTAQLQQLVDACEPGPAGVRDQALVLLGYATAAKRPTLTMLDIGDVRPASGPAGGVDEQLHVVRVWRSASEPRALIGVPHWGRARAGRCGDPLCPVCAVLTWQQLLASEGVTRGALFRPIDRAGNIAGVRRVAGGHDERLSVTAINYILRRLRERAGLDADVTPQSLRAGFAIESIEAGAAERHVRRHGGWAAGSRAFNVYTLGRLRADVDDELVDGAGGVVAARRGSSRGSAGRG